MHERPEMSLKLLFSATPYDKMQLGTCSLFFEGISFMFDFALLPTRGLKYIKSKTKPH